eukprot:gene1651-2178_t
MESDKTPKQSKLPWFYESRGEDAVTKEEQELLEDKWVDIVAAFPSYYRMVLTVQDDLCPKIMNLDVSCSGCGVSQIVGPRYHSIASTDFNLCEVCEHASVKTSTSTKTLLYAKKHDIFFHVKRLFASCASWTIAGQLYSERGRKIWWRVVQNYRVFAMVSLGIWTDEAVRDFEIKSQFKKQEQESAKVESYVTSTLGTTASEASVPGELLRA